MLLSQKELQKAVPFKKHTYCTIAWDSVPDFLNLVPQESAAAEAAAAVQAPQTDRADSRQGCSQKSKALDAETGSPSGCLSYKTKMITRKG